MAKGTAPVLSISDGVAMANEIILLRLLKFAVGLVCNSGMALRNEASGRTMWSRQASVGKRNSPTYAAGCCGCYCGGQCSNYITCVGLCAFVCQGTARDLQEAYGLLERSFVLISRHGRLPVIPKRHEDSCWETVL